MSSKRRIWPFGAAVTAVAMCVLILWWVETAAREARRPGGGFAQDVTVPEAQAKTGAAEPGPSARQRTTLPAAGALAGIMPRSWRDASAAEGTVGPAPPAAQSTQSPPPAQQDGNSAQETDSTRRFKEYLAQEKMPLFPRELKGIITEAELPLLKGVLEDPAQYTKWGHALFAICCLERPEEAARILLRHVSSVHDCRGNVSIIHSKLNSVVLLGWLPPEQGFPRLKDIMTEAGVKTLLKDWEKTALPMGLTPELLERITRLAAAKGLLRYAEDEYIRPVRDEYNRLKTLGQQTPLSQQDYAMLDAFQGVLVLYDMEKDMGFEQMITKLSSTDDPYESIALVAPYAEPYYDDKKNLLPIAQGK